MAKCKTKYCRKERSPKRTTCYKCQKRKWRAANPIKASYANLKTNANTRGKDFTISFEYFKKLVLDSGYMEGKGRKSDSLHIDRIKEHLGYIEGNLQVLTNANNVKKFYNKEYEDCPF